MSDGDGRSIRLSIEVPGTPEEVWAAIAKGDGITSWFVPTEVEERAGGLVRQDFGELGADTGSVVAWEPPHRVVFEGGASTGRPLAFEWLVEATSGDTCIVRLVNSGFGHGQDWDGDVDGMEAGWRLFLENLRLHLTYFPSQRAEAAVPVAMVAGSNASAWEDLCDAYSVPADLAEGETVSLSVAGSTWSGRIERAVAEERVRHYVFALDAPPATGFLAAEGDGDPVAISGYLYLYGDAAREHAQTWREVWATRWPAVDR